MALPNPQIDLAGSCTAVYNNTLYIYSPSGFQSLSLATGATWQTLPPGISVTGAVCVNANSTNTTPALYVVGGTANASQPDYPGLQRFDYTSNMWENISPEVLVTQNRRNHGAAFLPASASIVVYAGSQDSGNNLPSSQTFLISTTPPYQVLSFVSLAPPLTIPMLMPWNDSHALMVGGASDNTNLYLFSATGWSELGTALVDPIADEMTVQCDIVTGDDGSKVLQRYNMGVSPNTVVGYLLWQNGAPAAPGTIVGGGQAMKRGSTMSRMMKRDLTVANWPTYNATGAPSTTRDGFSIAQAPNGYAIISGGSTSNPIIIFNERQNNWVDNTQVFGPSLGNPTPTTTTATSGSKPSSTSGLVPSTSASPSPAPSPNHALVILGATLGAVLGFAAIVIILMLLLRWHNDRESRRLQDKKQEEEKENRLSFADQGALYMHEAGAGKESRPYTEHGRTDSVTSMQIMSGRIQQPPGSSHSRNTHRRGPSDGSTLGLMQHRGPAGGQSHDDGHYGYGAAAAGGLAGAAVGAGAAMELSNMQRHEDTTKSPSGTRVNSPYSPPLPPVRNLDTQEEEDESTGRSAGGWSTYFANDNPAADYPGTQGPTQQQKEDRHNQINSFLHSAPSTRTSEMSLSEYDTNPSRGNSNLRPLELNLGPKFVGAGGTPAPPAPTYGGGPGYGGGPSMEPRGRAISTSTYDPSHWSVLSGDGISPRSSVLSNIPPLGSGPPVGNAFAVPGNPLTNPLPPIPAGMTYSQAQNQNVRERLGMGGYTAARTQGPSPPPTTALPPFPRSESQQSQRGLGLRGGGREMDSPSPPATRQVARGPVLRKMTGDEDMSWLNINAGR